jgi:hypothetical protein
MKAPKLTGWCAARLTRTQARRLRRIMRADAARADLHHGDVEFWLQGLRKPTRNSYRVHESLAWCEYVTGIRVRGPRGEAV